MTIDLPRHLTWVDELYGGVWPDLDEDGLFDLARAWRHSAHTLREISEKANREAQDVIENNVAAPIIAFEQIWSRSQKNQEMSTSAHNHIAETVHSVGLAVQSTKITILGVLTLTATRLVHAKSRSAYAPGTAAEEAFSSAAAGRRAIDLARLRLRRFIEAEVGGNAFPLVRDILMRFRSIDLRTPG